MRGLLEREFLLKTDVRSFFTTTFLKFFFRSKIGANSNSSCGYSTSKAGITYLGQNRCFLSTTQYLLRFPFPKFNAPQKRAHPKTHTRTHTRTRAHVHACTHARTHAHMHARMHARTCTHTRTRAHAHTLTHPHTDGGIRRSVV